MANTKRSTIGSWQGFLSISCVLLVAVTMIQCSDSFVEPVAQLGPNPPQALKSTDGGLPPDGNLPSGALYAIRVPTAWNGDLVIYAHGYVSPDLELQMPDDEMEGISVSNTVTGLGYAYATTSYRTNGLVVPYAVQDLAELVVKFKSLNGTPRHIYFVGASEGALITALAVERHKELLSGAMPLSGPVGDFRRQIDYFGDFRVVFDYFFPDVLRVSGAPGAPRVSFVVPKSERDRWDSWYKPRIESAMGNPGNQHAVEQLLRVTGAAIDPNDPTTAVQTAVDLLWYNFFATEDARMKLGGQPFDNTTRWYSGSDNDWKLNFGAGHVQRIRATGDALKNISLYCQTSGNIHLPVVTMHTTLDHVVPYWHEPLYGLKILLKGSMLYRINIPIVRYGHGSFKISEVLAGFAVLVLRVTLTDLIVAENVLPDAAQQAEFLRLARENGANPRVQKATAVLK